MASILRPASFQDWVRTFVKEIEAWDYDTLCSCVFIAMCVYKQNSLTPGGNQLLGSNISNFAKWKRTYQPAVSWGGVGNCYTAIDIRNGPHAGVLGGGIDTTCVHVYTLRKVRVGD